MLKTKRILVMDDEADQLQTLCRGLLYLGFACLPVRSAAEAFEELTKPSGERIDLLLADLSSSSKAGAWLVAQLHRSRPDFPVLVVTGLVLSPEATAIAARGVPILRKPFTPEELGRAIDRALLRDTDPKGK